MADIEEQESNDRHVLDVDNEFEVKVGGPVSFLVDLWCGYMSAMSNLFNRCQLTTLDENKYPDGLTVAVNMGPENEIVETFTVLRDLRYSFLSEISDCFRGCRVADIEKQDSNGRHVLNVDNKPEVKVRGPVSFLVNLWCGIMSAMSNLFNRRQPKTLHGQEYSLGPTVTVENEIDDEVVENYGPFVEDLWSGYVTPEPDELGKRQFASVQAHESQHVHEMTVDDEFDNESRCFFRRRPMERIPT